MSVKSKIEELEMVLDGGRESGVYESDEIGQIVMEANMLLNTIGKDTGDATTLKRLLAKVNVKRQLSKRKNVKSPVVRANIKNVLKS